MNRIQRICEKYSDNMYTQTILLILSKLSSLTGIGTKHSLIESEEIDIKFGKEG